MNLGYIAEKLNATKAGEVTYTVKSGDVVPHCRGKRHDQ